ncbi:MAG: hypothetical protein AAB732_02500 [Patescibacteria group bacterium]
MNIILNLIPPKIKTELKIKQFYKIIEIFLVMIFLTIIFIAIILLFAEFILQSTFVKTITERMSILNNNHQNSNKTIKTINQIFHKTNDIQEKFISWSKILIYFNQVIPSDIKFYSFKNINNSTEIQINAIAKNREALLKFQENLQKYPAFTQIEFPFLNLMSKENIKFQINLKLDINQIEFKI